MVLADERISPSRNVVCYSSIGITFVMLAVYSTFVTIQVSFLIILDNTSGLFKSKYLSRSMFKFESNRIR